MRNCGNLLATISILLDRLMVSKAFLNGTHTMDEKVFFIPVIVCSSRTERPPIRLYNIARSSNGRTAAFGAVYRGSSPCLAARENNHTKVWLFSFEFAYKKFIGKEEWNRVSVMEK